MLIDLAKLKELLAKATKAPWVYMGSNNPYAGEIRSTDYESGTSYFAHVASIGDAEMDEDMELIVALRNAAAELIAAAEQAQELRKACRDLVDAIECDSGYSDALRHANAVLAEVKPCAK